MITPANALQFSMWLAVNHPSAFQAVLNRVVPPTAHRYRAGMAGLGAARGTSTYIPRRKKSIPHALRRGRFGGAPSMGAFGDDPVDLGLADTSPIDSTSSVDSIDVSDSVNSALSDPILQDINVDIAPSSTFDLSSAAASTDNSGGFWSSIGSGLSSIGSGVASAVGSVAGAVLNPTTLSAAGNLAATIIKANGATAQQQALLQAQVARTASGAGAHPVIYTTNPVTGQQTPMYYNAATGQYQAAPVASSLSSLFGTSAPGSIGSYMPYILIGGGLLLTVAVMGRR